VLLEDGVDEAGVLHDALHVLRPAAQLVLEPSHDERLALITRQQQQQQQQQQQHIRPSTLVLLLVFRVESPAPAAVLLLVDVLSSAAALHVQTCPVRADRMA
jgi:hypothetical protein